MNGTFGTKSSSINIIRFAPVFVTLVILLSGCRQINNLVNSNANGSTSAPQANTANSNVNTAQPLKDDLLGTWINVDDPTTKAIFTADEITQIAAKQESIIYKYKRLNDQEIELLDQKSGEKRMAK
ncbi:MAG: hypothetical protein IPN69_13250 [Acidobacteria bacterium]|nr:hypothetical protein [Acidobacteriota bacterium]